MSARTVVDLVFNLLGSMVPQDHGYALAELEQLILKLRATARPEEWPALSSGYRFEIERMQSEILDYLVEGAPPALTR